MPATPYIAAVCKIVNGAVYKNGELLFENTPASLSDFLQSVYRHFDIKYPKFYKMDSLSKAGFLAAEILLKDSFEPVNYKPEEIGLILANANSSLDTDIKYFETTKDIASPALFVYTLPNIVMGEISIRHNFKGENTFFISEKFDAVFIHLYVNNLLNNDTLQVCICGWIEVLNDQYQVVLLLIQKNTANVAEAFTIENLRKYIN